MVCDSSDKLGRESCPGPKLKGWVDGAGFVNVVERMYKLPVGPWARDPRMVGGSFFRGLVWRRESAFR
jgi:hypothetical protein